MPRVPEKALLVVACFSRHIEALDWARDELIARHGPIALTSPDFDFHHTAYYEQTMGQHLKKRLLVFDTLREPDILPDVKNQTIQMEKDLIATGQYPEARPLNLDPGLLQLGKFLLATTKDQSHRVYLRDNIYAEVTLRFQGNQYDVWPWTYADYREPVVREFLGAARGVLYEKRKALRAKG